ncbi:MAG TPA: PAS domain S-box protein, partial [Verrucomicrobiae bacterium]|nr:PAS domain S-box protein [Verrucomicrobiae bacterium]
MSAGENVTLSSESTNDLPPETSIPCAAAPLESILCTEELRRRPARPPDYEKENSALLALVGALADSPRTILQTLADKVLTIVDTDSAGLSLLTKDKKRFYWAAIAGAWQPHIGGGTPRDFGPCGDVLDRNVPLLFTHWERRYPYLGAAVPLVEEGLLVPFFVNGKSVGTIWVISHNSSRKFDTEDLRLLESMGRFASAAYQTFESIEDIRVEIAAREKAERELRKLTDGLEAQIQIRTDKLRHSDARKTAILNSALDCIVTIDHEARITEFNPAAERTFGHRREEVVGKQLADVIIPASLREKHRQGFSRYLSTGEAHMLGRRFVVQGLLNKQIAGELGTSEITVKIQRG